MKKTQSTETVAIPCGCIYFKTGATRGPVHPCAEHGTMTCAGCGGQGHVTPFGLMCHKCTFGPPRTAQREGRRRNARDEGDHRGPD